MKLYVLDTNTLIYYFKRIGQVSQRLLAQPSEHIAVFLVPMLRRGNAYLDAPASSPLIVTAGSVGIHSHAGAWEREKNHSYTR